MADISAELAAIESAVYGEEVRDAIHDGLEKMNSDLNTAIGTQVIDRATVDSILASEALSLKYSNYEEIVSATDLNVIAGDPGNYWIPYDKAQTILNIPVRRTGRLFVFPAKGTGASADGGIQIFASAQNAGRVGVWIRGWKGQTWSSWKKVATNEDLFNTDKHAINQSLVALAKAIDGEITSGVINLVPYETDTSAYIGEDNKIKFNSSVGSSYFVRIYNVAQGDSLTLTGTGAKLKGAYPFACYYSDLSAVGTVIVQGSTTATNYNTSYTAPSNGYVVVAGHTDYPTLTVSGITTIVESDLIKSTAEALGDDVYMSTGKVASNAVYSTYYISQNRTISSLGSSYSNFFVYQFPVIKDTSYIISGRASLKGAYPIAGFKTTSGTSGNVTVLLQNGNAYQDYYYAFTPQSNGYLFIASVNNCGLLMVETAQKTTELVARINELEKGIVNPWHGKKVVWIGTSVSFGQYASTSYPYEAAKYLGFELINCSVPGLSIEMENGTVKQYGSLTASKSEYTSAGVTIPSSPVTPYVPGGSYNNYYRTWENIFCSENADADLYVFDVVPNNNHFELTDWELFDTTNWRYTDNSTFEEHRETFLGALLFLMNKMYEINPNARMLLCIGSPFAYVNGRKAFNVIATKWNIGIVNLWGKINTSPKSLLKLKSENGTNNHPSTFAHQIMGKMLIGEMLKDGRRASLDVDTTLRISDAPADAKVTGDEIADLKADLSIGEYVYFTDGFLWNSSGAFWADAGYRASKQLMIIDPKKPWLKLSNYESDRVDLVFFDASGTFISPRQTLYQDSPLFINVVDKAPEGAVYFSVSIRKASNKPYVKLITASEWVGEYSGYVDTNGKICIGSSGNSQYMLKIASVQTGDIVKTLSSANNSISVLAFYDAEFNFVKRISSLSADIYDYMAVAPCAGYVIASSATVSFNDFAMSIEPFSNNDTDIVPDSHYPYYINNGAVIATETYYLSNCIVVPAGKVLMVSANCGSSAAILSDAQTNENIITGVGTTYDYWVCCYANETKVVRICWRPGYGDGLRAYLNTPKKQLNGKRLLGIGDSYLAGNNLVTDAYAKNHVWLNLLAMRNNMRIQNYGVNGTTIAECAAMSGTGTAPDSSNVAISDRIDRISDAFDVIFFEGGRNDFANGVPIGTLELANTDRNTFSGAVQYIIKKIVSLNAKSIIVGHPCWVSANGAEHSTTHLTQTDYMEAFKKACELNGVKCVDTKTNGIIVTQSDFRSMYFMSSTDVSHLNAAGHEKYVNTIEMLFR